MDPLTMGMSAVSSLMPLAEKGMDLLGKLLDSQNQGADNGQGKIGEDVHQQSSAQITFS
ncbi:hypothetical protein RCO22_18315 [Pseudomonas yamanorum]|jgi:hypothetical protein|uniref:Uncharacterized protein n=1 Tax=Pseudomonas yamanorum TaxID=515393 RepID=A0A1H2I2M7_9PSED|nr:MULTISPECIES: hypothetical protein [Pseudomonas]MBK5408435.1 hypothetical protein [Pseudomonas sp. TH34]MDR0190901.1 hypothetical protein [Pseudomonas yamanorum]NVZ92596.1 hypothetical protein [Pseudomonas yamanorum]NWD45479.1 hypothetical protein [Pseudomonas yamanorum]WVN15864.1 hypothetical protein VYI69_21085 [Pseudomonas yamanorum]